MEYPKYKREEKLHAKLSDKDVLKIRILRKNLLSYTKIGIIYGVTPPTVRYLFLSEEEKAKIKERQRLRKKKYSDEDRIAANNFNKRKKELYKKEYDSWRRSESNAWFKTEKGIALRNNSDYKNKNNEYMLKYYKENKESISINNKNYYKKNKEKIKKMSKEYYKNHKK